MGSIKMKAIIENDIVVGVAVGNSAGMKIPRSLCHISQKNLRFDGLNIINAEYLKQFYIDGNGIKHIIQKDLSWQSVNCNFNDELVFKNNQWRVKNNEDKFQEAIELTKEKRKQAYTTEADPIKNEYDFDLISNPAEAETKKLQWIAKVKEIKARYPFPSQAIATD